MNVRNVMTRSPVTIDPEALLGTAIRTMREKGVRHLPVVDGAGRLVGMVSDRDLRSAVFGPVVEEYLSPELRRRLRAAGEAVERLRVKDVMTWEVVTIGPEEPIARAAALMLEGGFGSVPVVDGGTLVGIVTDRDALSALTMLVPAVKGIDPALLW